MDEGTTPRGSAVRGDTAGARRWWVLAVVGLAQLMIVVDTTIVNIALPAAQRDLGFSDSAREWVITAYALAFGSLLLIGGRVADRIGRRAALLVGLAIFGAGSALGGVAPDFALLVVARVVQGVGGALLAPATLAVVTVTFVDPGERARAFSVFGAIGAIGGALGLVLGGVLTEHATWRWTLLVNLGLAGVALLGTLAAVGRDAPSDRRPLDLVGTALVTVGLFALVFGVSRAETDGWGAAVTWLPLALSAVLLAAFTAWQTRARTPLLPLRILLDRDRGASLTALLVANAGVFAVFLFLTYYLQSTLGYPPVRAGLAFMPLIVGTVVGAGLGLNVLARTLGPRVLVPGGLLIAAGGLAWLTGLGLDTAYWPGISVPLGVLGLGLGLVYPLAINLGTARLHEGDDGVAGALVNTTQQVGGSIGIALLSTLAASSAAAYAGSHAGARATVAAQATLHSYALAYWIAAGLYVAGAVAVAALYRPGIPDELRRPSPGDGAGSLAAQPA